MKDEKKLSEVFKRFTLPGMLADAIYEVSEDGRVRHYNVKKKGWQFLTTINQFKNKSGFEYVNNFKREKDTTKRVTDSVHRIVASAYCEKPSEQHRYVIHKDYNKMNNHFDNLKWVTQNDFNKHNSLNPKVKFARENRKGNVTNSKLTVDDVKRLKREIQKAEVPFYRIAKEFGITHTQLNRIRKGENWGHVKIDD